MAAISQAGAAVGILSKEGHTHKHTENNTTGRRRKGERRNTHSTTLSTHIHTERISLSLSFLSLSCRMSGVVLAAEKRITSKLLDIRKSTEKMYKVSTHTRQRADGAHDAGRSRWNGIRCDVLCLLPSSHFSLLFLSMCVSFRLMIMSLVLLPESLPMRIF